MSHYVPPYQITTTILNRVAEISERLGRWAANHNNSLSPHLRRDNRIKTIQASLAIENNTLSLEQVTAVLDGKRVLGLPHEIQEVRNAFIAYEKLNDWQADNIVVGYEGDTSFGKIRGTSLAATCGAGCYTQINWISTYRARLGYAMGGVLPYVTGGLAVGTVKSGGTATAFRDTDTKVGWVAGAGIELAFNENYSAKAEYSYVDLGKADFPGAPGFVVKARADAHIFRVGINRKFDIFKILSR